MRFRAAVGLLLTLGLATTTELTAQRGKQEHPRDAKELKANYERKLQREFMDNIEWHQKLKGALGRAKEQHLPVLMYFTRSDRAWPPTDELETKTLLEPWWVKSSQRFVAYINIQTGGLRMPQEAYYEAYFPRRPMIPLFALVDHKGTVINHFRLVDADDLERNLGEAEELLEARRAAKEKGSTPLAKKRLKLIEGLRVEKPNFRGLARLARTKGMDQHLVDRFRRMSNAAPVRKLVEKMGKEMRNAVESSGPEASDKVQRKYAAAMLKLYRRGTRIDDRSGQDYQKYWELTFDGALNAGDRKVAVAAFETYEKTYSNDPAFKDDIAKMRKRLNRMR